MFVWRLSSQEAPGECGWGPVDSRALRERMQWLTDPTGLLPKLLARCQTIDDAASLFVYIMRQGQVLVSDQEAHLFDRNELAVILSLHLEALRGADIGARYALYGALGPDGTVYGNEIIAALDGPVSASSPASPPEARLALAGLRVEHFQMWREQGRLCQILQPKYTVDIGRDFS